MGNKSVEQLAIVKKGVTMYLSPINYHSQVSINNTNHSPNFGCKKQAAEKIVITGKENITEIFNKFKTLEQRNKHSLKLDKWGHVISTKEECEKFLKYADEEILTKAKQNLAKRISRSEELKREYLTNPSAFRKNHPLYKEVLRLDRIGHKYDAVELCNEYQRIINERIRENQRINNPDGLLYKSQNTTILPKKYIESHEYNKLYTG